MLYIFLLVTFVTLSQGNAECVKPNGISDPLLYAKLPPNSPSPADSVFFQHILLGRQAVVDREIPIQMYHVHILLSNLFNTMGAYEERALDVWGNDQPVRFCPDSPDVALHRSVTLAYICYMSFSFAFPEIRRALDTLVTPWGINPQQCFDASMPKACQDMTTPWGLAFFRYRQMLDWVSRDGWNGDGSINREFNRIPFQDWTRNPYIPRNNPWNLRRGKKWQPLLENNNLGFLFFQEHVTPHIGHYGRSFYVDDETYCSSRAPKPNYNYAKELKKLIARSAAMAANDISKAKIQLFDNKFTSLVFLRTSLHFADGLQADTWEFIKADITTTVALYESTLAVWKEKIIHDAVRPPSRMTRDLAGRKITAYAGPNQGKKEMPAEDWEPYIRTMPHAEYPSASACLCTVFADSMKLIFGRDEFRVNGTEIPLSLSLAAGESKVEPGLPKANVTLEYKRWSDVARDCGQSRLDGGMHFTDAVPAGAALCKPLAKLSYDAIEALSSGKKPAFVQAFNTPLQRRPRC